MPFFPKLPSIHDNDSIVGEDDRGSPGFEPGFFDRKWIALKEVIGQGNFCQVHYGHLRSETSGRIRRTAVKRAKEPLDGQTSGFRTAAEEDQNLRNEYKLLRSLGYHKHVVKLMGCSVSSGGQFWILLELMSEGTLSLILRRYAAEKRRSCRSNSESVRNSLVIGNQMADMDMETATCSFIKKLCQGSSNDLTSSDLAALGLQVARGMKFVSSKQIIHRDLAARNILVNQHGVCKVADFGLSRHVNDDCRVGIGEYSVNSSTPLPIRWMAPEIFTKGIYTTKSDIWSFGVLLWEVLMLGCTPYPDLETREVIRRVKTGHHPEIPPTKVSNVRPPKILWKCWHFDAAQRPDFHNICQELENHLICQGLGGAASPSVSPLPNDQYTVIPTEMGYRCGERV